MSDRMGLVQAAQQLGAYGRGPDRQLAHISPDESEFLDYLQGGRRTNPHTGLPEYSLFGKILKAVARVAGAVGGFALGGPAGAALGAGAATKLTGGSWKDALKGAALSGIGGYAAQGLGGGGWGLTGDGAAESGAASMTPAVDFSPLSGVGTNTTAQAGGALAAGPATGLSAVKNLLAPVGGLPAAAAGLGALSVPMPQPSDSGPSGPPPGFGGNINLNVAPQQRAYQPYTGDYAHFGEPGGGAGWSFFDNVNPKPQFLAGGGPAMSMDGPEIPMGGLAGLGEAHNMMVHPAMTQPHYAEGGGVLPLRSPGNGLMGLGALRNPGIPSQIQSPMLADPMQAHAIARNTSPMAQRDDMRRAAIMGYMNAKGGGAIHGPGTGTSDDVPAMLSDGESVVDAATMDAAGGGSNDAGQRALEKWKQTQRKKAGVKNPKKPPAFQGAAHG